jgi:hypothetical protein
MRPDSLGMLMTMLFAFNFGIPFMHRANKNIVNYFGIMNALSSFQLCCVNKFCVSQKFNFMSGKQNFLCLCVDVKDNERSIHLISALLEIFQSQFPISVPLSSYAGFTSFRAVISKHMKRTE